MALILGMSRVTLAYMPGRILSSRIRHAPGGAECGSGNRSP
jgi:hypothetical protein